SNPAQLQTPWILKSFEGKVLHDLWQVQYRMYYRRETEQSRWHDSFDHFNMNNNPSFEGLWDSRSSFFNIPQPVTILFSEEQIAGGTLPPRMNNWPACYTPYGYVLVPFSGRQIFDNLIQSLPNKQTFT